MNTKKENAVDKLWLEFDLERLTKKVSYEETITFRKKVFPCDKHSARASVSRAAPCIIFCVTIGKFVG